MSRLFAGRRASFRKGQGLGPWGGDTGMKVFTSCASPRLACQGRVHCPGLGTQASLRDTPKQPGPGACSAAWRASCPS